MRKLRSDTLRHTFTPGQQKQIQQWLFADHLSCREIIRERMDLVTETLQLRALQPSFRLEPRPLERNQANQNRQYLTHNRPKPG